MARRALFFGLGSVLAGLAALFEVPGVERSAVVLLVVLAETIVAVAWTYGRAVTSPRPDRSHDSSPPDGEVPVVDLSAIEGSPNAILPEIRICRSTVVVDGRGVSRRIRDGSGPLLGRLGIFSLFVGRDGKSWSDREVVEAYRALERMGLWIEREAGRWAVPVNLELLSPCFVADDSADESVELAPSLDPFRTVLDESNADIKGIASASRSCSRLGVSDLADLVGKVDPVAGHDQTVWIVHHLRAGRSSAIEPDRFQYPGARVALCYARESSISEPIVGLPFVDPVTLAHELLHLFGASDKYGTSLRSFPPGSVTSRDVMRLDETRLSRLRIDSLTSSEIGWSTMPSQSHVKSPAPTRG
jgi:hypothetical protein